MSVISTFASGALLAFGCLGRGGRLWVLTGFALLAISFVAQIVALSRLRELTGRSAPRADVPNDRKLASTAMATVRATKVYLGPGEEHKATFVGNEVVIFCEPKGGPELARSVTVAPGPTNVRLKQARDAGTRDGAYFVDQ